MWFPIWRHFVNLVSNLTSVRIVSNLSSCCRCGFKIGAPKRSGWRKTQVASAGAPIIAREGKVKAMATRLHDLQTMTSVKTARTSSQVRRTHIPEHFNGDMKLPRYNKLALVGNRLSYAVICFFLFRVSFKICVFKIYPHANTVIWSLRHLIIIFYLRGTYFHCNGDCKLHFFLVFSPVFQVFIYFSIICH